jgi:hypothetical protein
MIFEDEGVVRFQIRANIDNPGPRPKDGIARQAQGEGFV